TNRGFGENAKCPAPLPFANQPSQRNTPASLPSSNRTFVPEEFICAAERPARLLMGIPRDELKLCSYPSLRRSVSWTVSGFGVGSISHSPEIAPWFWIFMAGVNPRTNKAPVKISAPHARPRIILEIRFNITTSMAELLIGRIDLDCTCCKQPVSF